MTSGVYPDPPIFAWRTMMALAYVLAAIAGVWSYVWPSQSYSDAQPLVMHLWSGSLLVGGVVCAVATITRFYPAELVAVWVLGFGIAVYAVLSWVVTMEKLTNGTRALMLTFTLVLVLTRAFTLMSADAQARRRVRARRYDTEVTG